MDIKAIMESVFEIASDVAAKTEMKTDDVAVAVLKTLYDHFGVKLFGAAAAEGSATDNLPSAAVPQVETLIAQIESGQS